MAGEGYILTGEDFDRTGKAVSRVEQELHGIRPTVSPTDYFVTHDLKIQSGAPNSFGYPARIQTWSDTAGTWSDFDTETVRVKDPNGGTFAINEYVLGARLVGVNSSSVTCFSARSAGVPPTSEVVYPVIIGEFNATQPLPPPGAPGTPVLVLEFTIRNGPGTYEINWLGSASALWQQGSGSFSMIGEATIIGGTQYPADTRHNYWSENSNYIAASVGFTMKVIAGSAFMVRYHVTATGVLIGGQGISAVVSKLKGE